MAKGEGLSDADMRGLGKPASLPEMAGGVELEVAARACSTLALCSASAAASLQVVAPSAGSSKGGAKAAG